MSSPRAHEVRREERERKKEKDVYAFICNENSNQPKWYYFTYAQLPPELKIHCSVHATGLIVADRIS